MRPPCELVQREYLPVLRSRLSKKLRERGYSQNDIAECLGLTQAAVSKYLAQDYSPNPLNETVDITASRMANMIIQENSTSDLLVKEVCEACMSLRIGADICMMHRESVPSLRDPQCEICASLLGGEDKFLVKRAKILEEMTEALRLIYKSNSFAKLVPQVRANLVACNKDASNISDVIGVPGRITLIEGKARALVGPRFGASKHMALLLLEVRKLWSDVFACLCLSGRSEIIEAAREEGVRIIGIKESQSDPVMIAGLVRESKAKRRQGIATGIHVPGGIGVEPILYLFAKSPLELSSISEALGSHQRF
ncbi:MAG: thiamine-phosphate synthase family protein [Candidatus Thorarchaeota archaeon]